MGCLYLETSGLFTTSYFCKKEKKSIDSVWAKDYCHSNYKYQECPRYKGGSGGSGCFLTTACVRAKNLPDNCDELVTLRNFRDDYVYSLQNGNRILMEYYSIAPRIVDYIDRQSNAEERYECLYNELIVPAKKLIENDDYEGAFSLYSSIFTSLKNECVSEV